TDSGGNGAACRRRCRRLRMLSGADRRSLNFHFADIAASCASAQPPSDFCRAESPTPLQAAKRHTMRFEIIDHPFADKIDPAKGTFAFGISNTGEIVGEYETNIDYLGFADIGGSFTTVSGPLIATSNQANGVNASGQIVGIYEDAFFHTHGFLL